MMLALIFAQMNVDFYSILLGGFILSVLHALIPNHWLPVLAISRKEKWSIAQTTYITFISGLSHALSTVLIGVIIGLVGVSLADTISSFTHVITPIILVSLGLFYIYQHHRHKHFHLHAEVKPVGKNKIAVGLAMAMFFSPCLEIEAYFLMAGAHGWYHVAILAALYTIVTVLGMVLWVRLTYQGLLKINWHSLEHNAGVITGVTLMATGVVSFFIH